jgi:hypothetical protein
VRLDIYLRLKYTQTKKFNEQLAAYGDKINAVTATTKVHARATAAWVITIGVAGLLAARERDPAFLEGPSVGSIVLAGLYAVAVARYADQVAWDRPVAWIFVLLLAGLAATGVAGVMRPRGGTRRSMGENLF